MLSARTLGNRQLIGSGPQVDSGGLCLAQRYLAYLRGRKLCWVSPSLGSGKAAEDQGHTQLRSPEAQETCAQTSVTEQWWARRATQPL